SQYNYIIVLAIDQTRSLSSGSTGNRGIARREGACVCLVSTRAIVLINQASFVERLVGDRDVPPGVLLLKDIGAWALNDQVGGVFPDQLHPSLTLAHEHLALLNRAIRGRGERVGTL